MVISKSPAHRQRSLKPTRQSVSPEGHGDFLIEIYEEWVRNDVGKVFVMNFEWALNAWIGNPSPVCVHARTCGRSIVIEHNGDIFACDHYVYPQYRIGNILKNSLRQLIEGLLRKRFWYRQGERTSPMVP